MKTTYTDKKCLETKSNFPPLSTSALKPKKKNDFCSRETLKNPPFFSNFRQQPSSVQALAMQAVDGNMWNDVGSIRSCSTSMRYRPPPPPPPPKQPLKKRIKDAFRAFVAFVFSKVGICVLVIGYLFVGAAMFQQLEGPEEQLIRFQMGKYRSSVVKNLWKITEQYNTLHPANWSLEVTQIIEEYQARIVQEADKGYDGSDIPAHKWTFTGALLYSITVITTIGTYLLSMKFSGILLLKKISSNFFSSLR